MSIASEIQRLQNAKAFLKKSLESKNIIINNNDLLDNYCSYINVIIGDMSKPLTVKSRQDEYGYGSSFSLRWNNTGCYTERIIEYKLYYKDGTISEWTELYPGDQIYCESYSNYDQQIPKIELRGNNESYAESTYQYHYFSFIGGDIEIYGNINSLLNNTLGKVQDFAFCNLFTYNNTLISCKNLLFPSNEIGKYAYYSMFSYCNSLIDAPSVLPAMLLDDECYSEMFSRCGNLINAPKLPAEKLASNCYCRMFDNCTSLIIPPDLPATVLANNCYDSMFMNCQNLTRSPELPDATLNYDYEYINMFVGCNNLNYVKCLIKIPNSSSMRGWLSNVSPSGTFVKYSSAEWDIGQDGIPEGWTIQDA